MMRPAFFPLYEYPELEPVRLKWKDICDEAQGLRRNMVWIEDERTTKRVWAFAPLQVEKDDRDGYLDRLSPAFRSRAPKTVELLHEIPGVLAYGFSLLLSRGRISAHAHRNPFVTAVLGLSVGDHCWLTVGDETQRIQQGNVLIFDYTLRHEVFNDSSADRLVLLVLLPNKSLVQTAPRKTTRPQN